MDKEEVNSGVTKIAEQFVEEKNSIKSYFEGREMKYWYVDGCNVQKECAEVVDDLFSERGEILELLITICRIYREICDALGESFGANHQYCQ